MDAPSTDTMIKDQAVFDYLQEMANQGYDFCGIVVIAQALNFTIEETETSLFNLERYGLVTLIRLDCALMARSSVTRPAPYLGDQ